MMALKEPLLAMDRYVLCFRRAYVVRVNHEDHLLTRLSLLTDPSEPSGVLQSSHWFTVQSDSSFEKTAQPAY